MKILILLFAYNGRDTESIIPLSWYLEKIFKYEVKFSSIFDYSYQIDLYKPDVLLLNNIVGSEFNVNAADYAYKRKIKVISLTSEGLFIDKFIDQYIWGDSKDKTLKWDKFFVWTEKFLKIIQEKHPQYRNTFDLSGSTGIDRYKIYDFLDKESFLRRYNKKRYKKVVLYIGFAFTQLQNKGYLKRYGIFKNVEVCKREMLRVREILEKLILNNKDILFIMKKHPDELGSKGDIDQDWESDNVLFFSDQESIGDLINASDITIVYESTATFEGYALNKVVLNIFPSNDNLARHDGYRGNALIKSYISGQKLLDEFFTKSKIKEFDDKNEIREKMIKDNVGSIDGLNSWRTAIKIDKFLRKQKINTQFKKTPKGALIHIVLKYNLFLQFLPKYKNSLILNYYNDFYKYKLLKKVYDSQIKKFYMKRIKHK